MTLSAHLTELRNRLLIGVGAIALGAVVGLVYYKQLFDLLLEPYEQAAESLEEQQIVIAMSTPPYRMTVSVSPGTKYRSSSKTP